MASLEREHAQQCEEIARLERDDGERRVLLSNANARINDLTHELDEARSERDMCESAVGEMIAGAPQDRLNERGRVARTLDYLAHLHLERDSKDPIGDGEDAAFLHTTADFIRAMPDEATP